MCPAAGVCDSHGVSAPAIASRNPSNRRVPASQGVITGVLSPQTLLMFPIISHPRSASTDCSNEIAPPDGAHVCRSIVYRGAETVGATMRASDAIWRIERPN